MPRIAVIDYGLANIRSVVNALSAFDVTVDIAATGKDVLNAEAIVLPGVGHFDAVMRGLRQRGHVEALHRRVIEDKVRFLGICVGLQVLAEGSEEGDEPGLGVLPGVCRKFDNDKVRVPHIGWNEIDVIGDSRLLRGLEPPLDFYFVHSYRLPVAATSPGAVVGVCTYESPFVAAVEVENIAAVQFHPEKSQLAGMKLLETFLTSL